MENSSDPIVQWQIGFQAQILGPPKLQLLPLLSIPWPWPQPSGSQDQRTLFVFSFWTSPIFSASSRSPYSGNLSQPAGNSGPIITNISLPLFIKLTSHLFASFLGSQQLTVWAADLYRLKSLRLMMGVAPLKETMESEVSKRRLLNTSCRVIPLTTQPQFLWDAQGNQECGWTFLFSLEKSYWKWETGMSDKILIDEIFSGLEIIQGKQTFPILLQRWIQSLHIASSSLYVKPIFSLPSHSLTCCIHRGYIFQINNINGVRLMGYLIISQFPRRVKFNSIHL